MTNNDFRSAWNATVSGKGFALSDFDVDPVHERDLFSPVERERIRQTAIAQAQCAQWRLDEAKAA